MTLAVSKHLSPEVKTPNVATQEDSPPESPWSLFWVKRVSEMQIRGYASPGSSVGVTDIEFLLGGTAGQTPLVTSSRGSRGYHGRNVVIIIFVLFFLMYATHKDTQYHVTLLNSVELTMLLQY